MGCQQSTIVENPSIESQQVAKLPTHNQHSKGTIVYNTLDKIKERCKLYIHNPKYVYKSCGEYIVILKKLETTITNEDRTGIVNRKFAAFRANELMTIFIIHKYDLDRQINHIKNTSYKLKHVVYEIGKITTSENYEFDKDKIFVAGLHYYVSIDPAYYFDLWDVKLYTGQYLEWFSCGNKLYYGEFKFGYPVGIWILWNVKNTGYRKIQYGGQGVAIDVTPHIEI